MIKLKNSGFTLVEILVALVISVISIGAIFSSYQYFNQTHKSVSQKAAISQSGREALSVIARDLRNAGYINPNFVGNSSEGIRDLRTAQLKMIEVKSKRYGKYKQSDWLSIWYTTSPKDRKRVQYYHKKYEDSNSYYLARDVVMNPEGGSNWAHPVNKELFVPYVEDFQVILKDINGDILVPVCNSCAALEQSQGSNNKAGNKTLGQANMLEVHTAEVYLTLRSPKEVYKENKKTKIVNGETGYGYGSNITISPDDKYYRETFFVSVHTRNLSAPEIQSQSFGTSIATSASYNK
tara:strand:+ start:284 stop:1165 length:882 start_codon:yes stop_codon:yes gene_type:complete